MKKLLSTIAILLLTGGVSIAGPVTSMIEWDTPTVRVANNSCDQSGVALTPDEILSLQYTVRYRVKGNTSWTEFDVGVPRAALVGLNYMTTYEVAASAHFPGTTSLCYSDVLEFSTGTGPAPGGCKNLRVAP